MIQKNTVYFVGSGPGDPELITIKAKKLLEIADIIIYSRIFIKSRNIGFCQERG